MIRALPSLDYDDSKLDELGEHFGFADSVTVEQLAAAGVPNRTVFDLRRRLDPAAAAAEVCLDGEMQGVAGAHNVRVYLPLGVQGPILRGVCVCGWFP